MSGLLLLQPVRDFDRTLGGLHQLDHVELGEKFSLLVAELTPRPVQVLQTELVDALLHKGLLRAEAGVDDVAKTLLRCYDIYPKHTVVFNVIGDYLYVGDVRSEEAIAVLNRPEMRAEVTGEHEWRVPRVVQLPLDRALRCEGIAVRRAT